MIRLCQLERPWNSLHVILPAVCAIFLTISACPPSAIGQQEPKTASSKSSERIPSRIHETREAANALALRIDQKIAARWSTEKIEPAPQADDAEFLRRVWLDIAGKIPPVAEVRAFLADANPNKRAQLVDRLLESPAYVTHTTNIWRNLLVPEANTDLNLRFQAPSFDVWLRKQILSGAGYDDLVRQLVTSPLSRDGAVLFYAAKESKPENLAAATSRLFLGVRLECAQCHHHPFAKWKQEEFWSFAAFYAGLSRPDQPVPSPTQFGTEDPRRHELPIPGKNKTVSARFLNGNEPQWDTGNQISPRAKLAEWLTSAENPYFTRAAVNRNWAHYFGNGLVDPPDDFDENNPPSHPEVLDELASEFAAHDFNTEFVIQTITATRAYQLTSRQTHPRQSERALFARMNVKGLTADQLFDSLIQATGYYDESVGDPRVFSDGSQREAIRNLFRQDNPNLLEIRTSIPQALTLMNGAFIEEATDPAQSTTLAAVIDSPFLDTASRIETLYFATLSRPPHPEEMKKLVAYVDGRGTGNASHPPLGEVFKTILSDKRPVQGTDKNTALGDVFWALLNGSEFLVNH